MVDCSHARSHACCQSYARTDSSQPCVCKETDHIYHNLYCYDGCRTSALEPQRTCLRVFRWWVPCVEFRAG